MKEELYITNADRPLAWGRGDSYFSIGFEYDGQELSACLNADKKIMVDAADYPEEVEALMVECLLHYMKTYIGVDDYILAKEYLTHERE